MTFSGFVCPPWIAVETAHRSMTYEVMLCRAEVFTKWRSFKSLMPAVIAVPSHSDVQGGGLVSPDILFPTLTARYQVDYSLRSPIGFAYRLDSSTTGQCGCLGRRYHFAGLTSWSATRLCEDHQSCEISNS